MKHTDFCREFNRNGIVFGNLKNLLRLNLRNNKISNLPNNFKNFTNQTTINLSGNPIRSLSYINSNLIEKFHVDPFNLANEGKKLYICYLKQKKKILNISQDYFFDANENYWNLLWEYYRKTPKELAKQYAENPTSLTQDEKERLIHEANHQIRCHLEEYLPPDDPILMKISNRLKKTLSNNLVML